MSVSNPHGGRLCSLILCSLTPAICSLICSTHRRFSQMCNEPRKLGAKRFRSSIALSAVKSTGTIEHTIASSDDAGNKVIYDLSITKELYQSNSIDISSALAKPLFRIYVHYWSRNLPQLAGCFCLRHALLFFSELFFWSHFSN